MELLDSFDITCGDLSGPSRSMPSSGRKLRLRRRVCVCVCMCVCVCVEAARGECDHAASPDIREEARDETCHYWVYLSVYANKRSRRRGGGDCFTATAENKRGRYSRAPTRTGENIPVRSTMPKLQVTRQHCVCVCVFRCQSHTCKNFFFFKEEKEL